MEEERPERNFKVKKEENRKTQIRPKERVELRGLLDYAIDKLLAVQERLLIEHPVGPGAGYWTIFEVVSDMKFAFYFDKPEFGEMGKEAWRMFQRYVKAPTFDRRRIF